MRCYTTASYRPPPPLISKTWKLRHRFIAFLVVWGMLQNGNSSETFGNPLSPSLQKMAVIPFAGYRGITSLWDGVYGGIRNSLSCNGLVWENKNFDVRFDCAKWKFIKQTSQKCFNWVVNVFPSTVTNYKKMWKNPLISPKLFTVCISWLEAASYVLPHHTDRSQAWDDYCIARQLQRYLIITVALTSPLSC